MGVFGRLAGANLGLGIQRSFADALRKRLEAERALQQQMAMAKLQSQLSGNTQKDLLERRFAFDTISKLIQDGNIEGARGFANQYAPYLLPAVEAAATGTKRQRDISFLRENWQQMTKYITDSEDAKRFSEAMTSGDTATAYQIALKHQVPFAKLALEQGKTELEQGKADVEGTKTRNALAEQQLKFFEDTYGFRVDQERFKAEGLDLDNQRTRQAMDVEMKRLAMDMERWGIEKGILQQDAEGKELTNRLLAARVKVAEATTADEIAKAHGEVEELEQRLLKNSLDIEARQLKNRLLKGEVDDYFKTSSLRLTSQIEELASKSPEAAEAWLKENADVLKASNIDPASMNALVEKYKRLKQFEDPTRANAVSQVELALKTPPTKPEDVDKRLAEIGKVLDEAVKRGSMSEDEKAAFLGAIRAAWSGALDAATIEALKLQLEQAKLSQKSGEQAQKEWLDMLKLRASIAGRRLEAARNDRETIRQKLVAEGCLNSLVSTMNIMTGGSEMPGVNFGTEKCKSLAAQYKRAEAVIAETDMNLRAIDLMLGGQKLPQKGGYTTDQINQVMNGFVNELKSSGKTLTPEEAKVEITKRLPDLPATTVDRFVQALAEEGVVAVPKPGKLPESESPTKSANDFLRRGVPLGSEYPTREE